MRKGLFWLKGNFVKCKIQFLKAGDFYGGEFSTLHEQFSGTLKIATDYLQLMKELKWVDVGIVISELVINYTH